MPATQTDPSQPLAARVCTAAKAGAKPAQAGASSQARARHLDVLMDLLERNGPMTSRDLSAACGVGHSIVSTTLRRARRDGCVALEAIDLEARARETLLKRGVSWDVRYRLVSRTAACAKPRAVAPRKRPASASDSKRTLGSMDPILLVFAPRLQATVARLDKLSSARMCFPLGREEPSADTRASRP